MKTSPPVPATYIAFFHLHTYERIKAIP